MRYRQLVGMLISVISALGYQVATPVPGRTLSDPSASLLSRHAGLQDDRSPGIDLRGIPPPYVFARFCMLPWGELWKVAGEGEVVVDYMDGMEEITRPSDKTLNAIFVTTAGSAWAVGDSGTIVYSSDWGKNWQIQHSGTGENLHSVICLDDRHCWAAGTHGVLVRSDDAGQTWALVSTKLKETLYALQFTSTRIGWAVGENGIVIHTEDGGETWSIIHLDKPMSPSNLKGGLTNWLAVKFYNPRVGWIAGYFWIATTEDGGAHWTCKHIDNFAGIGVVSKDGSTVWAIDAGLGSPANRWSHDGGHTWSRFVPSQAIGSGSRSH